MDIKNINGSSPEQNRIEKNNEIKKTRPSEKKNVHDNGSFRPDQVGDRADISPSARELFALRAEAAEYLDELRDSETVSKEQLEEIAEKILTGYYFKDEVLEVIVDKIMKLPYFK